MPDIIKISELDEALALADAAEFPYYQDNGGQNTTYKAPMTQIGAKIVEGLTYQGINLPAGAGNKTVENSLNYLLNAIGGDPNGNISDSYDPTAAYVKGDLCIYENALYICTAPTTGTFDPTKWTATTIDNVIGDLSQLTTTDKSSLVGAVNEVARYTLDMTDTASGAIATFESEYALPLRNLEIEINAVQEAGTPTPSSPKAISGFTGANIHVADDENPHVIDNVTAITWQSEAGTVYGGSLDVTSGVLTVTHKVIDMGSLTWNTVGMGGGRTGFKSTISDIEFSPAATVVFNGKCECYASLNGNDVYLGNTGIATWGANTHDIAVYDPDRESLSGNDFKTAVTGSDLVYTLQTPVTYQLTPTQISAIVGTNNVFTDTNGDTSLEYYTNKTVKDAINEVNDKADTNATAIGDLSQLTTTVKSSLVGAVNELAPTAYTQATRSSALSSGALGFVKIGKVVIANLNYTTNTSNVSTHDTVLYSDLPPAISNIYLNFVDEVGNATRVRVGTDGKMHLHYSSIVANKEINGSFVYLSA
mgnify:CR=1 FL=1